MREGAEKEQKTLENLKKEINKTLGNLRKLSISSCFKEGLRCDHIFACPQGVSISAGASMFFWVTSPSSHLLLTDPAFCPSEAEATDYHTYLKDWETLVSYVIQRDENKTTQKSETIFSKNPAPVVQKKEAQKAADSIGTRLGKINLSHNKGGFGVSLALFFLGVSFLTLGTTTFLSFGVLPAISGLGAQPSPHFK